MAHPLDRNKSSLNDPEARRVLFNRVETLCARIEFGTIEIEVANGVPKDVRVMHQNFRVDLTDPAVRDIIKPANDSSHDGGSTTS